jgi:guanylate cyclase
MYVYNYVPRVEKWHPFTVYVFIGEHLALVDLVRALDNRKLLENGDYIIISVDDKICDPKVQCNYVNTGKVFAW